MQNLELKVIETKELLKLTKDNDPSTIQVTAIRVIGFYKHLRSQDRRSSKKELLMLIGDHKGNPSYILRQARKGAGAMGIKAFSTYDGIIKDAQRVGIRYFSVDTKLCMTIDELLSALGVESFDDLEV
ncbi:hypothetical protein [Neptuniibacter sp. QD37_11]|uniref:hypothetical protein n=1 Tax=Neptuniibacter sp. QD37_11 TaxID=3398209 RepID=UPI0039F4BB29